MNAPELFFCPFGSEVAVMSALCVCNMQNATSTFFCTFFSALVNGSSSVSLESECSTLSGDGYSTVSQETAIIRERKEDSTKRHSRFVIKMNMFELQYVGIHKFVYTK